MPSSETQEKQLYIPIDLQTTNPLIAKEWHPEKNGALTPEMVTAGSTKKL